MASQPRQRAHAGATPTGGRSSGSLPDRDTTVAALQHRHRTSKGQGLAELGAADCNAAAPGIGRVTACHALKLIAVTFSVVSLAFSADIISVMPTVTSSRLLNQPEATTDSTWANAAAPQTVWNPKPVLPGGAADPATEADGPVAVPQMDATPRAEPIRDYGLPKDHPYTPPEARVKTALTRPLRTADYYARAGGVLHVAPRANATDGIPNGADLRSGWPKGVFRTHEADPDPIVCTFDGFLAQGDAQRVIESALPQMRRAGVTADDGGSRTSQGRSNDLTWLPHDHAAVSAPPTCLSNTAAAISVCDARCWTEVFSRR